MGQQSQWFDECLSCGKKHVSIATTRPSKCVDCGGRLVAVGGVTNGQRIDIPLSETERDILRQQAEK